MSWLFSRALVEASLEGTYWDGEPSALLSATPMPLAFSSPDKTMGFSRLSRYGMTCAPLSERLGEEVLMSFLVDSPAPTSVAQEREPALMESSPDSGARWLESWAMFDPVTSTWRTAQYSLLGGLVSFSETWPRWGLMRNGVLYPQRTRAPCTSESASGLWPTPTASLGTKGGRITPRKGREGGTPIEAVSARMWPTPRANDGEKRGNFDASNPRNGLAGAARMFATPTARDWRSGKASQETHDRNSRPLSEQIGGLLNPTWVEWLMGWPIGWTDFAPLAMDKFHEWQQQHGDC